jgi:hypothetical protein
MAPRWLAATLAAALMIGSSWSGTVASAAQAPDPPSSNGQWTTATLSEGREDLVAATVGTKVLFISGCKDGCESPHDLAALGRRGRL